MSTEPSHQGVGVEAALLKRVADGNLEAFEELYHRYQRRLFAYGMRMLGEAQSAEELTDDVLLEVWRRAAGFRSESRPSTWIFGIAHHMAVNILRRRRVPLDELAAASEQADPAESALASAIRSDQREQLFRAIQALSPVQREVIELTFNENLSLQEIASIQHCPVGTVKTRMFYARQALRTILGNAREAGSIQHDT